MTAPAAPGAPTVPAGSTVSLPYAATRSDTGPAGGPGRDEPASRWEGIRRRAQAVRPMTWLTLALALVLWVAGGALGWELLRVVALAATVLVALAALTMAGRDRLTAVVRLAPPRVTAGDESLGQVLVGNDSPRRSASVTLDVPVGGRIKRFDVPGLPGHGQRLIDLPIATARRGVISLGPPRVTRGDPFGFFRRDRRIAGEQSLHVHPRLVPVPPLSSGLVRDLEGQATTDPSVADLDFHMLRDYTEGDDHRHVHWRSSVRVSPDPEDMKLLVKQYIDTRRSHLVIMLDGRDESYRTPEDYEDAVTLAASMSGRAARDDVDLTVVAGDESLDRVGLPRTLDGFARTAPNDVDLSVLAARAVRVAPGMSSAVVVCGTTQPFADVLRAAAHLPAQVTVVVLRVERGRRSTISTQGGLTVLDAGDTADLGKLVAGSGLT